MLDYGPNLRALIEAECIDPDTVNGLSAQQLSTIEELTAVEVANLISARAKVGKSVCVWWI